MLRTRVQTALVLAAIVAVAVLLLDTPYAALVFGVFWTIGATEWSRLAGMSRSGRIVFGAAIAALMIAVILAGGLPERALHALLEVTVLSWLAAFALVRRFPRPQPAWPIVLIGFVVLPGAWLAFYALHSIRPGLILAGLIIIWSADIGAFFVGRSLGRRALAPRVSPKKTWEGVFGGLAGAACAGLIAAWILGLPMPVLVPLAAAAALVSVGGDLTVSMLKRRAGVKDSGMLLPGHGGMLDRFDGVTAALPFFALGLQFTHVLD